MALKVSRDPADPTADELERTLREIRFVTRLSSAEQARLRQLVWQFLDHVVIDGDGGVEPTHADRVKIAASCAILYVGRPEWPFPPVVKVTITPWKFDKDNQPQTAGGSAGLSWPDRTVDLERANLDESFRDQEDGYQLAIREFTHCLDFDAHGYVDGVPCNLAQDHVPAWLHILERAWKSAGHDGSPLRAYAGTKISEALAVAAETFWEQPRALRDKDPELYLLLVRFFAQDPAAAP